MLVDGRETDCCQTCQCQASSSKLCRRCTSSMASIRLPRTDGGQTSGSLSSGSHLRPGRYGFLGRALTPVKHIVSRCADERASLCPMQISVDAIQSPHASEDVTVFAAQSLLRKVFQHASSCRGVCMPPNAEALTCRRSWETWLSFVPRTATWDAASSCLQVGHLTSVSGHRCRSNSTASPKRTGRPCWPASRHACRG